MSCWIGCREIYEGAERHRVIVSGVIADVSGEEIGGIVGLTPFLSPVLPGRVNMAVD